MDFYESSRPYQVRININLLIYFFHSFIRKFCTRARSKIGNSQTDLNTVSGGMKGRASDYAVKSKSTDEEKPCKKEKTPQDWLDTTPPPPYFMAPSAPPAYTVDPPPKYQQTANQDDKIRYWLFLRVYFSLFVLLLLLWWEIIFENMYLSIKTIFESVRREK